MESSLILLFQKYSEQKYIEEVRENNKDNKLSRIL